ncbi:MAG: hypothetical protein LBQ57_09990 [Spirochaetales bacterium]|jgi:hypothetical protein|nr:hypothetical protein [Spirochaetales bacterium]
MVNRNFLCIFFRIFLAVLALGLFSCGGAPRETLPREERFSIGIGKMEDEIDIFQFQQVAALSETSLYMRDGIFYVGSGSSFKVMEFTSHGDILSMYYNPDENPQPVILQDASAGGARSNRRAYPYAFHSVGNIAVSGAKMLYVEDLLPREREVTDEKLGIKLNKIILRFENGEYRGYLGQDGIGGIPFPFIQSLHILKDDEISVLCRTMTDWIVFWFSAGGERLAAVRISAENLPAPEGEGVFANLETIIPDYAEKVLYLKIDYYREGKDGPTGIKYGIEDSISRIYRFDAGTSRYDGFLDIPQNVRRERGGNLFEMQDVRYSYEFIGVAAGGNFFLKSREEGNVHQLLILAQNGHVLRRRDLAVEDSQLLFSVFHVSPEGILSALLASETGARVVWWRSDALLEGI